MENLTCFQNKQDEYYQYWESFIVQWYKWKKEECREAPNGWSNPDDLPLYNNKEAKDMSSLYIPEPWWGNDGRQPLHCVVVNFNPGEGGEEQTWENIPYKSSYTDDIVNANNVLLFTKCWHWSKRAKPILKIVKEKEEENIKEWLGLQHCLSVELIPWHTKTVTPSYWDYLKANISKVYEHSICFAANEARRIDNQMLNSVVILKMSGQNTKTLLKYLDEAKISSSKVKPIQSVNSGKGKYMEFTINDLPDIRFISIWGARSRNNFPSNEEMKEIFEKIFNHI